MDARNREGTGPRKASGTNPMNRLVPYLDLFGRLSDEELSRLARAPTSAVENLRQQVDEVNRALGRFADLLVRLSDEELARLTGASTKTIRFWRLSQPRHLQGSPSQTNAETTPTPQPLPRRPSNPEDSSESSSSSWTRRQRAEQQQQQRSGESSDPAESATFVIDTVE